jgi:hypothetical protein
MIKYIWSALSLCFHLAMLGKAEKYSEKAAEPMLRLSAVRRVIIPMYRGSIVWNCTGPGDDGI